LEALAAESRTGSKSRIEFLRRLYSGAGYRERIFAPKGPETMANAEIHNGGYYRSLTRNMVVIMILVSFTPLILISGTILYYFEFSYREKVAEHIKVLIKKHKQNIDNFLNEKLSDIRAVALSYDYGQLTNETFLTERLRILQDAYGRSFVDLGVVDEDGRQIAYAGPFSLRSADYSKAEWFKEAMNHDVYISDVFSGLRGSPHFIVTSRREHRGKHWVLRATVDFEAFNSLVGNIRVGRTGFAFILSKNGEVQVNPRAEMLPSREMYLDFLRDPKIGPDEVAFLETTDKSDTEYLEVMAPLKNGDWLLAIQQKASDAYSVIRHVRQLVVVIFLVGGIGIVAVAMLLSRRMVRHIARADREKEMMNEQVIEAGKLASLGELAAGIAHEINNPVAIMVEEAGWIQDLLIEEDLKKTQNLEEFERALGQIRIQGRRCKEITHKLLSFARKTDPTVKDVQLNEIVEDVVSLSEQRAKYSNVRMTTTLESGLPNINVSPSEVQQVLLNLINNALDAMDGKGGTLDITSRTGGGFVVVDVADNGPGIAKANLPRIFDPFFTTKPVGKGTGLGLSICYGIVKKLGGDITVNSAVGMGTAFHVYFPLPKSAPSYSRESKEPAAGA